MSVVWDKEFNAAASEATRLLCQAVHARPDHLAAPAPTTPAQEKSRRKRVYVKADHPCPPLGEPAAQWVVDNVLNGPPVPVPVYGIDYLPVIAHSLAALRRRRRRRIAIGTALLLPLPFVPVAWAAWTLTVVLVAYGRRLRTRWWPVSLAVPPAAVALFGHRTSMAVLPFVAVAGVTVVFAVDRLLARRAIALLIDEGVRPEHVPRMPKRLRRRLLAIHKHQRRAEHPYDWDDRFVGSGRDVWSPATINLQLRPAEPGSLPLPPDDGALLDEVAKLLRDPESGVLTEPLPFLTAVRVSGLPAAMWQARTKQKPVPEPDLRGLGGRAPSGRPDRLYLRVQAISWHGQIVVNVFVHAALEANELRLTVRPQVVTPLYNLLRVTVPMDWRPLLKNAVLDAFGLVRVIWKQRPKPERRQEKFPVGLRDRFSVREATDMHQNDDAKRHVVLIQNGVFRSVERHLLNRGFNTESFRQQVSTVINTIQIYGDNNAPIQNVVGGGDASQTTGPQ